MIQDLNFGIEIEMTGITRRRAAELAAEHFNTDYVHVGGGYDKYRVQDETGRSWNFVRDGSIQTYRKERGRVLVEAGGEYSVEMVSPICEYRDIETVQELVRKLRHAGAVSNDSTGIHVHVDASRFDAASLRNLTNIMRSKEDILYKALQVNVNREHSYCRKVEDTFINELNNKRPKTKDELKNLWYNGEDGSYIHYHSSRYHALNLHSVFQKGTVEYRLYNGTMHAGKVKTYIQISLAISNQALNQKRASHTRTTSANEKYTFRTWLLRMGMIGKEFETARMFLLEHLEGNIAWKDPSQIEKQRERFEARRAAQEAVVTAEIEEVEVVTDNEEIATEQAESTIRGGMSL